jgi:hypothetical protein
MAQGNGQLFNLADHAPMQPNIIGPETPPSSPQHHAPLQQHEGFFQGVIDEQIHHQQNQNQNILFPPLPPNPPPRVEYLPRQLPPHQPGSFIPNFQMPQQDIHAINPRVYPRLANANAIESGQGHGGATPRYKKTKKSKSKSKSKKTKNNKHKRKSSKKNK